MGVMEIAQEIVWCITHSKTSHFNISVLAQFKQTKYNVLLSTCAHHHVIFGYPAVWREVLQHWHHEGQAAIPVAQQQHHANQVNYTHHSTGQVISHVENLIERK